MRWSTHPTRTTSRGGSPARLSAWWTPRAITLTSSNERRLQSPRSNSFEDERRPMPVELDPDAHAFVDAVETYLTPRPMHQQGVAETRRRLAELPRQEGPAV